MKKYLVSWTDRGVSPQWSILCSQYERVERTDGIPCRTYNKY